MIDEVTTNSPCPKWQRAFADSETEIKNKAFEHGVGVRLQQAKHQEEFKEMLREAARSGISIGADVFHSRHLSDKELKKKIHDEIEKVVSLG